MPTAPNNKTYTATSSADISSAWNAFERTCSDPDDAAAWLVFADDYLYTAAEGVAKIERERDEAQDESSRRQGFIDDLQREINALTNERDRLQEELSNLQSKLDEE